MVSQDGQIRSFVNNGSASTCPAAIFFTSQSTGGTSSSCWCLSQTPFIQSSVPSGQAGPASGPDGTKTSMETMNMSSPLENLYPQTDQEPVFQQPGPVASAVSSGPLHFPARDIMSPDQIEDGSWLPDVFVYKINQKLMDGF